jgi:hypothetical protein
MPPEVYVKRWANPRKECDQGRQQKKKKKRELERGNVPAVSAVLVHVGGKTNQHQEKASLMLPLGRSRREKSGMSVCCCQSETRSVIGLTRWEMMTTRSPKLWFTVWVDPAETRSPIRSTCVSATPFHHDSPDCTCSVFRPVYLEPWTGTTLKPSEQL